MFIVESKGLSIKDNSNSFRIVIRNNAVNISPFDMEVFTRTLKGQLANENPKQTPLVIIQKIYQKGDTIYETNMWMKRNYNSISIYLNLISTRKGSQSNENSSSTNIPLYTAQKIVNRYIDIDDYDDENYL